MRTIEVISSDVDKATEKGLLMLDATLDKVYVKVIDKGSMLKKAKIEMTLFDNDQEKEQFMAQVQTKEVKVAPTSDVTSRPKRSANLPYSREDNAKALELARDFIVNFMGTYGVEANIDAYEQDQDVMISVTGSKLGALIGFHGDCLDAIQTIMNAYVREKFASYKRKVYLDIEHYRSRRVETLQAIGERMAGKAIKYRRSVKLEPMNSYERRIIHTTLQGMEHIATHSEGEEPHRFLVIDYID